MSTSTRDDFYAENYYDYAVQAHLNGTMRNIEQTTSWISLTRVILTTLLRIGFFLVQVGSVPVNNVNLILLQNLVDFCCVTTMYFLVGFVIAYNGDLSGLIGEGYWIGHPAIDKEEAMIGWQAVIITSAISTSGIVGRTHTVGYLTIGVLLSGLVQPLLIHWAWTPKGWMAENQLTGKRVNFRDYAGSSVIHLIGGIFALIGCITLGRRVLKLKEIDDASIAAGSSGTVFAGQLLIFVGLQALFMNNFEIKARMVIKDPLHAYINNLLAASVCSLFVVAFHFILTREAFNHWTVMRCVQGTIAGLVIVSAGADVYSPQAAIGLSCAGAVVFYLMSRQVFQSALEDYCNVVATHLTCGLLGSFLLPFCRIQVGKDVVQILLNSCWQLICLIAMIVLATVVATVAFVLLEILGILRNRSEVLNHVRAVVAMRRGPTRTYMQRLFSPDNGGLYLQPGPPENVENVSNDGSRVQKYEMEADKLESDPSKQRPVDRKTKEDDKKVETGERTKKQRQVHTLPGYNFVVVDHGNGESIGNRIFNTVQKLKYKKTLLRKVWRSDHDVRYGSEKRSVKEIWSLSSVSRDNINNAMTLKRDHRLRRTIKLVNLREKQSIRNAEVKVLLEPRMDFSSSDSQEDNCDLKPVGDGVVGNVVRANYHFACNVLETNGDRG